MHSRRSRYLRHRFPPEIISHAVWLYHRYCLSFRDVEDLLAERGVIVLYETVRQWCGKFGPDYARAARRFFRRLLNSQRQEPVRLVTDKLGSYRVAHRDLMPLVTHDTTRYANNRAEVSHQPTRQRERQMRGFTSSNHAQRFLHVHGIIQNLFRVGRHRDAVPDSVLRIRALQLLEYFAQLLDLLAVQGPVALAQSLEGS